MTSVDSVPAAGTGLLDPGTWEDRLFAPIERGDQPFADIREPATGALLGRYLAVSALQARGAAFAAAAAQPAWERTPPQERAAVLRSAGELFERHATEIQDWIVRETGAIRAKAELETRIAAQECFEAAALATAPSGEVLAAAEPRWSFARRRAAGVVSVISPFNFPLILSIRSVAPALALGNAVLLKPDPRTTVSGGIGIARIFEAAGLATGLLSVLPGGADVGEAVVTAPPVRVVSFTGSTVAGRHVGELAARHLKRAHLELGGNNALVVLPGADIARAASAGAFGSFLHQGQICMTTGRHLVHESLYERYVAELSRRADALVVGDPTGAVHLGPIIDERQRDRVASIVQDAVDQGAVVRAGGTHDGLYFRPTVLTGLSGENPAWREEIFGPVAPVRSFRTTEEAIALVSENDYGLAVAVLGDVGEAMRIADRVRSGKVHINEQTVVDEANAPFGGVGDSGTGSRFGGATANLEAFTETQWLTVRPDIAPYPF